MYVMISFGDYWRAVVAVVAQSPLTLREQRAVAHVPTSGYAGSRLSTTRNLAVVRLASAVMVPRPRPWMGPPAPTYGAASSPAVPR